MKEQGWHYNNYLVKVGEPCRSWLKETNVYCLLEMGNELLFKVLLTQPSKPTSCLYADLSAFNDVTQFPPLLLAILIAITAAGALCYLNIKERNQQKQNVFSFLCDTHTKHTVYRGKYI